MAGRNRSRQDHWDEVGRLMEGRGMPVRREEADRWADRHELPHSWDLASAIEDLYEERLSKVAIDRIGEAIVAAYRLGREDAGKGEG